MHPVLVRAVAAASLSVALFSTSALRAQVQAPPHHLEYVQVQSGVLANPQPIEGVVWSQFVFLAPEIPWLRLHFHAAHLDKGSFLRMTSVLDGATMLMRQEHFAQWSNTSAFFNGNAVLIELVAGPNTTSNHVEIQQVMAGDIDPQEPDTICGSTDDRVPSTDPRAGRISPIGCTGWIINVPSSGIDRAHLSAGHCFGTGQTLQFAVPASGANCALVFPPPSKQFAIDSTTSQQVNTGIGSDWWVYRCFPNSTTGLTSFQEQGAAFDLATVLPANGTTLRNYGYGLDGTNTNGAGGGNSSCSCSSGAGTGTRNQTQQTHTGPLGSVSGNRLNYAFDTCGGNSGSPVINEVTGQAIGIHTNGGCTTTAGTNNSGTSVLNTALQAAILAVAPPSGLPNDNCTGAVAVAIGVNGPFQNGAATLSTGAWTCGTGVGRDVWFRFDVECAGSHTFDTCTATRDFDTVLQVFSGSCSALSLIACNDDGCALGSSVTASLGVGTHFIRVGGYNGQSGNFDLVVTRPTAYDAGPFITSNTGGSGGAPVSILQTAPPMNLTTFGFTAGGVFSLADDFVTNGPWCVSAIELFAYQTGTLAPSINGVFLEVYNGDPSAGGIPVAGSPGFANNLVTAAGYAVSNTMTGSFRANETTPTDGTRPIQSVLVTLANPLPLNSAAIPGGRYFLQWRLTGTGASGPFVPPITVLGSAATGNAIQSNAGVWGPALSGGVGQGMPFKLYGSTTAAPGAFLNLGGGCSTASLEVRGAPHVGGVLQVDLVNTTPGAIPLIILGFSDPNTPFSPACTCVQHATLDVLNVGASYNWQIPTVPAGVGFEILVQGDQLFAPTLACDIGIGFRFELTDGFRIRFW